MQRTVSGNVQIPDAMLPASDQLSIVLVSSEISPFSKTGGLADVADKLAVALARLGHRVFETRNTKPETRNPKP